MRLFRRISCMALLLTIFFSINAYAFSSTSHTDAHYTYGYRWTWLSDALCVQFKPGGPVTAKMPREVLAQEYDVGAIAGGYGLKGDGIPRDTYTGQWSQADDSTWSFVFDDNTIPIDLTKIDGVLYAFNGYGELADGYNYWNGQKTGPDGVVTCTDPEFETYLKTQYVPDCTSHK